MEDNNKKLRGLFGAPVGDRENSMTARSPWSITNARYLLLGTNGAL